MTITLSTDLPAYPTFTEGSSKKVKAALSDKKTAQKIMQSKEAQELLKKLLNK